MILAVSLLAGCAAETSPTENTAAKYTEPERPPVSALQCTSPAALSAIHPAGRAKVIVFWPDYEAEITTIQIVDTASDTVYAETTLKGVWDCNAQTFSDGRLALCNRGSLQWKFLDTSLNEIGTMTAENVDGFFSNDGSIYYYLKDHVLCHQVVAPLLIMEFPARCTPSASCRMKVCWWERSMKTAHFFFMSLIQYSFPLRRLQTRHIFPRHFQSIREVFWDMNELSARTEVEYEPHTVMVDDGEGNLVESTETVAIVYLYITVEHKTAEDMRVDHSFDKNQRQQLSELLSPEYASMWTPVLYGISSGLTDSDEMLVAVALSQVGNVGGEPYWSWYGYSHRVEWCACFVSWCLDQCGYIDDGSAPKFADCEVGARWFQRHGQWMDGVATPVPGCIIFFDGVEDNGTQDGQPEHVGIAKFFFQHSFYHQLLEFWCVFLVWYSF